MTERATFSYQTIEDREIESFQSHVEDGNNFEVENNGESWKKGATYMMITLFTFCFYFYCVFVGLEKVLFDFESSHSNRRLDEAVDASSTSTTTPSCTWKDGAILTGAGAAAGAALVLGGFAIIGLGPSGPIAGGLFASNMGSGLVAGSWMALTQSAAMTGTAYGTGAAVGAVTSAWAACKVTV